MPKYQVTGDILHSGVITIEAESEADALELLRDGDIVEWFDVVHETSPEAFRWNGEAIEAVS